MGLFTPKYPKSDTPAPAAPASHTEQARDALNRMFEADSRGDTATGDREMRAAQRHIDATKNRR
ncbi:hypothetical protein ABZZ74_23425 [Streptomyces sp. NPDC006476]|uniref:hypothetical protein n=1 Tax=Streptomyces sp. NPDC006476 TaxID=3157175 RepID=UPI0033A05F6D